MPFVFNPAPIVASTIALQKQIKTQQEPQIKNKICPCLYCHHYPKLASNDVLACKNCIDGSYQNKEV